MSTPTNLSVSNLSISSVNLRLSWDAPEGVVVSQYQVGFLPAEVTPDESPVVAYTTSETSYDLTVVPPGYRLFVRAVDGDGVAGDWSEPLAVESVIVTSTEITQVRALIPDLDATDQIFTNAQLQVYLDIYAGNVRRAAAAAINAISVDEVLLLKVVRTDDLQVNGALVAEQLRKRAKDLNDEADASDSSVASDVFLVVGGYPRTDYKRPPEATAWPWRVC